MISRIKSKLETLRMMNAEKEALIFTLEKENGKLKEENSVLNRELLCFKMGYGSTNNEELKEENRQLRVLVEEYTKRNENYQTKTCNLNKELNSLKEENKRLKEVNDSLIRVVGRKQEEKHTEPQKTVIDVYMYERELKRSQGLQSDVYGLIRENEDLKGKINDLEDKLETIKTLLEVGL